MYAVKNKKYGDSFHNTFVEYGPMALCIRLEDKLSRTKQLLLAKESATPDESIIDTLMDTANYAIMGIMELLPEFAATETPAPQKVEEEDSDDEDDDSDDESEVDLEDEEEEEVDDDEEEDFEDMSKEDLKMFLKNHKVKFHSKATKDDLVKLAKGVK